MIRVHNAKVPQFRVPPAFVPDAYVPAATVQTDDLDDAFARTQHLDRSWFANAGVTPEPGGSLRSTSVGDVLELGGRYYAVAPVGFLPLELAVPAEPAAPGPGAGVGAPAIAAAIEVLDDADDEVDPWEGYEGDEESEYHAEIVAPATAANTRRPWDCRACNGRGYRPSGAPCGGCHGSGFGHPAFEGAGEALRRVIDALRHAAGALSPRRCGDCGRLERFFGRAAGDHERCLPF